MSRREIPLTWADGSGLWVCSVPPTYANPEGVAIQAIKHQLAMRGECSPDWTPTVEPRPGGVRGAQLFRESEQMGSPRGLVTSG